MSNLPRKKLRRKVKADAYDAPYFRTDAPMEVIDDGFRPDPSVHSTDADPDKPEDLVQPDIPKTEIGESERNRVLTSPLPLVVSAPEAIEKMEMLNQLVQEGRPDLANESAAVAQAIDNMERKALGENEFETGEAAAGHDPVTGLPTSQAAAPQFVIGDRVVMALDDGDYQGEIQKDNGDGTYDIKTDQMATFRRVPAESIAKPEMLQPVASGEKKPMPKEKKAPRRKAKKNIKAVQEGYKLVDGVKIVEDNGKPRAFDPNKDDTVPAELYANGEGKLALIGPDGEENYEDKANDEVELAYWKAIHSMVPKPPAEKPETAVPAAPAPQPAPSEPAKEAVAAKRRAKPKPVEAAAEEKTAAQKLLETHKVEAANFWIVEKGKPVQASDAAKLDQALAAGLKPEAVLGIFAAREAASKFNKIVGGPDDALELAKDELDNAQIGITMTQLEMSEGNVEMARDAAEAVARSSREAAELADEAAAGIVGTVVASGVKSELAKDPTFAVVLSTLQAEDSAQVEIVASKDGIVSARLKASEEGHRKIAELAGALKDEGFMGAELEHPGFIYLYDYPGLPKDYFVMATPWFNDPDMVDVQLGKDVNGIQDAVPFFSTQGIMPPETAPLEEVVAAYKDVLESMQDQLAAAAKADAESTGGAVEASAFDQIPELEIGGGFTARRKKGKAEGKDAAHEIEVSDKDGKVVATYPDAFGDDTVMIIKFLRQVMDIKDADDKAAAKPDSKPEGGEKGGKKDEGESAAEKPRALPAVKPEKDSDDEKKKSEEKEKEKKELDTKASWLEARIADCRLVVEAMLKKGHVTALQADIDAELLNKKNLRQAQEVAARKAVDREVMRLLAKPEAELQIIKASLPHLKERLVKVQASEGSIEPANLSAAGLIHEGSGKKTSLGVALTAAFHR